MSERKRETVRGQDEHVTGGAEAANAFGRKLMQGWTPTFATKQAEEAWIAGGRLPLPEVGSGKDGAYTIKDVRSDTRSEEA